MILSSILPKSSTSMFRSALVKICTVFVLAALLPLQGHADDHADTVKRIKSAFIYNIAKFVTWPESTEHSDNVLEVCFYQRDFIGSAFATVEGRSIRGRTLTKRVVSGMEQIQGCAVLLLSHAEMKNYQQEYLTTGDRSGLLTIADMTASMRKGQVYPGVLVNLVRRKTSVGFEVSLHQVKQRQLSMSAQLLKLATILDREE